MTAAADARGESLWTVAADQNEHHPDVSGFSASAGLPGLSPLGRSIVRVASRCTVVPLRRVISLVSVTLSSDFTTKVVALRVLPADPVMPLMRVTLLPSRESELFREFSLL
jgi:hypothetical protein